MKLMAALAALVLSFSATAQVSDELTLGDFQFTPPAEVFISTEEGFEDNTFLSVGGLNALFGSTELVVYSLELAYPAPGPSTAYTSFERLNTQFGQLFAVAGTPTNNVESGAIQLAIWELAGVRNFDIVDDLDGSWALAQQYLSSMGESQAQALPVSVFENKSYRYYVSTTVTPIPEPGTMAMLAMGLLALGTFKTRRQSQR